MKQMLTIYLLLLAFSLSAETLDEIALIEKHKSVTDNHSTQRSQKPETNTFRLSTGRQINITHWQMVHFMRSDCGFCQQFNPRLDQVAKSLRLPVFIYGFDGKGDATFPQVVPVNQQVLNEFFPELPQVTPTDFIVNTDTLVAIPVSQGMISEEALFNRLEATFLLAEKLEVLR